MLKKSTYLYDKRFERAKIDNVTFDFLDGFAVGTDGVISTSTCDPSCDSIPSNDSTTSSENWNQWPVDSSYQKNGKNETNFDMIW